MTTYKEIYGTNVEVLSSDPTNPVEGQIWYNSTSQTLKGYALVAGSWATAGAMNVSKFGSGSAGIQTSALIFGGRDPAASPISSSESYNGTSWSPTPSLNTSRSYLGGAGASNTAGLAFGGQTTVNTGVNESYNGSSWTELNDLNTARRFLVGCGTNTAALAFGGFVTASSGATETWNGTSWTSSPNSMNSARYGPGGAGTNTAALVFGGITTVVVGNTETWNGTSWTEVNDLNTGRYVVGSAGTNTAALCFGGTPPTTGATETWNGTSWTEVNDLNIARDGLSGAGTNTAAVAMGGTNSPSNPSAVTLATEEWSGPAVQTVNITVS